MSGESIVPVVWTSGSSPPARFRASARTSSHTHIQDSGQAQPRRIAGGTRKNTGELA
jgi:hypothetical protein